VQKFPVSLLRCIAIALGVVPLLMFGSAHANPANKAAMVKHFGNLMPERLRTCGLCHVADHPDGASSLSEFPHNPFGRAMRIVGEQLAEEGKPDAMSDRMQAIRDQDADEDGVANLLEILLDTQPGDSQDLPELANSARTEQALARYSAKLNRYRWEPFQPVQQPAVPLAAANWGHNPIDAFIDKQRREQNLRPQPEASPEQLLRRVTLDLTGISPTPEAITRFVDQYAKDPQAYDRVVTELLQHPGYGQRWGRHWMDVWRYSDWAGYKDALRESQRHIWHWRDWIVESLNDDLGYDQMVMQMLAADEMPRDSVDLRATGFLARSYFTNRDQWMDNVVKHTSQALMGVTLGCAKCHDHMTDPFEQTEYYALRAVFESYHVRTDRVPGELNRDKNGVPRVYDRTINAKTYLLARGDERYPVKDQPIEPGTPAALGGELQISPVSLTHQATHPDQRTFVIEALLAAAGQKVVDAKSDSDRLAAQRSLDALQAELELEAQEAAGLSEDSQAWKAAATQVVTLYRAAEFAAAEAALAKTQQALDDAEKKLTAVTAKEKAKAIQQAKSAHAAAEKAHRAAKTRFDKATAAVAEKPTTKWKRREQMVYPAVSSGRRLAFARWLTDSNNPLTARVAVNHIWLRHFGRAIVPTVNDFGFGGREPTHPALLDWLATEWMRRDWSMKELHRLIVTSATYRMASTSDPESYSIDPDNASYWRGPIGRMEGEIVRDNLLAISGRLDPTLGGPDIDNTLAQTSRRRSIYLRHAHEKLVPFVQIFDGPAVSECYQRETSVQPHQALAMVNSQLTVEAATAIADELRQATGEDEAAFVRQAYLRVLCRYPEEQELAPCLEFLADGTQPHRNLVIVLLNHNDFVSIR